MKICDALVLALKDFGVRYIFGVSGANIEHVHDAINRLGQNQIVSVMAKSESGAAFMADGHARVHRRLAVCCTTSGGGMLNLLAGIGESYAESVPVLAIVGQAPLALEGKGAFQDSSGINHSINGETLWRSVSKFVAKIRKSSDFWPHLQQAIAGALSNRPGPTVLLIPRDMFGQEVEPCPRDWFVKLKAKLYMSERKENGTRTLIDMLRSSAAPALILGHGMRRSRYKDSVIQFARLSQIPVFTTLSARAEYPNDLPNYLGLIGAAGHPSAHAYIEHEADFLLTVGTGLSVMNRGPLASVFEKKKNVLVNVDAYSLATTFTNATFHRCDAGDFFARLVEMVRREHVTFQLPQGYQRQVYKPTAAESIESNFGQFHSGRTLLQSEAIARIENTLPRNGHLVFDAGNCAAAALHYTEVPTGSTSTIALGMGGMGYAFGAAIGAQLGSAPHTRTIALVGDGAFLMCGLEAHTAVDLSLPILYIVFNNNMHGMCVTRQQLYFEGRIECATYSPVDIAQIARGFGPPDRLWVGKAQTREELENLLIDYMKQNHLPGILEVCVGHDEMPPFAPFLPKSAPVMEFNRNFFHTLSEMNKEVAVANNRRRNNN